MKFCPKCGTAVSDEVIFCPQCGCAIDYGNNGNNGNAYGFGGYNRGRYNNGYYGNGELEQIHSVLSALLPIYGFAYWFMKRREDPEKAEKCLRIAGISMAVYFLLYVGLFFLLMI